MKMRRRNDLIKTATKSFVVIAIEDVAALVQAAACGFLYFLPVELL
jgi:hypothetical protein